MLTDIRLFFRTDCTRLFHFFKVQKFYLYFIFDGVKLRFDQTLNGTERPQVQNIDLNYLGKVYTWCLSAPRIDFFCGGKK